MKNKALTRFSSFTILLFCLTIPVFGLQTSQGADSIPDNGFKIKTIVVDAGHGGHDPGARGSFSVEKEVTLALANKLQKAIQSEMKDVNVVMTRTSDVFVELYKRAEIANKNKGNLFISLHCNSLAPIRKTQVVGHKKGKNGKKIPIYKTVSVPNRSGRGVLLLVYGLHRSDEQMEALRENASIFGEKNYKENYDGYDPNDPSSFIVLNAFKSAYRKQSIQFGTLLNDEFTETDNRRSTGVKQQGVLVLARSAMPSVLVETGFINNPDDEKYLNSDEGQDEIINSIIRAVKKYRKEYETSN
ncbi:MAG: N-acetylmuramoyl-L-alanine amidase family protein [Sphingobacteriaceae bacterium]